MTPSKNVCSVCKQEFFSARSLRRHENTYRETSCLKPCKVIKAMNKGDLKCKFGCTDTSFTYSSHRSLSKHYKKYHAVQIQSALAEQINPAPVEEDAPAIQTEPVLTSTEEYALAKANRILAGTF